MPWRLGLGMLEPNAATWYELTESDLERAAQSLTRDVHGPEDAAYNQALRDLAAKVREYW